MTPKFRGIGERLKKLQHHLDDQAGKLDEKITATEERSVGVFANAHKNLDAAHKNLADVDHLLDDIERSNQGPPLDDSLNGSAASAAGPRSTEVARKG